MRVARRARFAAAGGPDIHPHRFSPAGDRARWDRDVARFDAGLATVEALLQDIVAGRISDDQARERAMALFGVQGPWYTVGWTTAVAIERCFGRPVLVDAMRRSWTVLGMYNRAHAQCPSHAGPATATWDTALVAALDA